MVFFVCTGLDWISMWVSVAQEWLCYRQIRSLHVFPGGPFFHMNVLAKARIEN